MKQNGTRQGWEATKQAIRGTVSWLKQIRVFRKGFINFRNIYSIKPAFPLESSHGFFSLPLIPHATDIPKCLNCVYSITPNMLPFIMFILLGKFTIHTPKTPAELFRNPSVLSRRVFAFWKHSSKMYMNHHRKQAKRNSLKRHFCKMWKIYSVVLWTWNCWLSASHKQCSLVESSREVCLDKKSRHLAASPFKTNFASFLQ